MLLYEPSRAVAVSEVVHRERVVVLGRQHGVVSRRQQVLRELGDGVVGLKLPDACLLLVEVEYVLQHRLRYYSALKFLDVEPESRANRILKYKDTMFKPYLIQILARLHAVVSELTTIHLSKRLESEYRILVHISRDIIETLLFIFIFDIFVLRGELERLSIAENSKRQI